MGRKQIAIGALIALSSTLVACGGGGGSALSEDDFLDELDDICADVARDLDDLDAPSEGDFGELEDFAEEAVEILQDGVERLGEISPPDDLLDGFDDLVDAAEDQLAAANDLVEAAADEDEDAIEEIYGDLESASTDFNEAADDLGADDCIDEEEPATTDPPTTDGTAPGTTGGRPASTAPVVSAPRNTEPPLTMPPATAPVGSVSELDVLNEFVPPIDYTFEALAAGTLDDLIDQISSNPDLGPVTSEFGAATVVDESGQYVATLFILYTSPDFELADDDAAADAWLDLVAEEEVSSMEYTTANGVFGYLSDFGDGTGAFGTILGSFGIAVFGDEGFDIDGVVDGLISANG